MSKSANTNRGNFANNRERARTAGSKGGKNSGGVGGAAHNPGNFANNPNRAADAGRKGGTRSRRSP